ncbi:hypothetical protein ABOONEI_174 [Aciduliprofundum boonei T469]|nr:hypothetical protein ABOONEI_174 [Aciduliprofundum boonei T469]
MFFEEFNLPYIEDNLEGCQVRKILLFISFLFAYNAKDLGIINENL